MLQFLKSNSKEGKDAANFVTKLEQDFEGGETLGAGNFGQIIKARRKCDNHEFAIKIIKFDSNLEDIDSIRREANLLSKLTNQVNIVRYFNSWIETAEIPTSEYDKLDNEESLCSEILKLSRDGRMSEDTLDGNSEFGDDYTEDEDYEDDEENKTDDDSSVVFQAEFKQVKYLFIQMELCDKRSLRTEIDNDLYLEEEKLAKYFREICDGLAYIHKKRIVHRDLKPENIFLTPDNVIKIGDFGLSKQITLDNYLEYEHSDALPYGSLTATCGTLIYMAPEIMEGNRFNIKADIYSLGVIYFEMCSKPMTHMEKQKIFFPIIFQQWKNINFAKNNVHKKNLIENLLRVNHHERPTCEQILKVLNSPKSTDMLKEVLQQNRKISNQEWRFFETANATSVEKSSSLQLLFSTATKIFEQHGGQNISMPTFVPSVIEFSTNLTSLLNTQGNSTSVANTSKIAFCYYLAKHNIRKIRRYSVGKVYEEGTFSPTELPECVFEAVSPYRDDHVLDAEVMYIAEKIHKELLPETEVYFVINHGLILLSIFRYCRISKDTANSILDMLTNPDTFLQIFPHLNLEQEVENFIHSINKKFSIAEAQTLLLLLLNTQNQVFARININKLKKALNQMKEIEECARKFGVKSPIYLQPLFTKKMFSGGFMFKMVISEKQTIASGGRFHALITKCCLKKRRQPLDISAVDVSFHVKNILGVLNVKPRSVDVVIWAKVPTMAIPLYTELLSKNIKTELVKDSIVLFSSTTGTPLVVIRVLSEHKCCMFSVNADGGRLKVTSIIYQGTWKDPEFFETLHKRLFPPLLPKITFTTN